MFEHPIITLELRSMKHQIQHYLSESVLNLNGELEKAVDKAIANFDFDGAVIKAASEVLATEIRRYFIHEEGAVIIKKTVAEVLAKTFKKKT